jgi:hypothetical protein
MSSTLLSSSASSRAAGSQRRGWLERARPGGSELMAREYIDRGDGEFPHVELGIEYEIGPPIEAITQEESYLEGMNKCNICGMRYVSTHRCPRDICPYCKADYSGTTADALYLHMKYHQYHLSQHEPGAKLDQEKPRADLLLSFSRALLAVAQVATYGADKYTKDGWEKVPSGWERYTAAMLRHVLAEKQELLDSESSMLHAAHVAWNALARLELFLRDKEKG